VTVSPFQRIGLYLKPGHEGAAEAVSQLIEFLEARGHTLALDEEAARQTGRDNLRVAGGELPDRVDLAVVLGGDGTMLAVVRQIGPRPVPVVGVNFGSLGFLTEISRERMLPALGGILDGRCRIEERMKLQVEVRREDRVQERFQALNDAVINYGALARIIEVEVSVDDRFLSLYRSDGLIVSTPTGSTAYALSAGGPILVPTSRNLLLAPICPHTLTHRPLVLENTSTISIRLRSHGHVMLTVDGQTGVSLAEQDEVRVSQADHPARLVFPEAPGFFAVLRQKLKWGER